MRKTVIILILAALLGIPAAASAYSPSVAYTYDVHGIPLELRDPYEVYTVLDGAKLEISPFKDIQGLYVKDDKLYICDSGNNRIVVLDADLKLGRTIESFIHDGNEDYFNYPTDIAIASNGDLYIVDYQNFRIVVLAQDGTCKAVIDHVTSEMLGSDYQFTPTKIVLDSSDSIYVVAKGVNFGIMNIDIDGNVKSFLGAARVSFNMMLYIKKVLMTKAQSKQLSKIVPTEYNNIFIDPDNFIYGTISVIDPIGLTNYINSSIYTVGGVPVSRLSESLTTKILRWMTPASTQTGQNDVVKKLNMKGDDILRRSGYYPVVGELDYYTETSGAEGKGGPSSFVDIVVHENGIYSVLDQNRNRIFTYDDNGVLLFVFGGTGKNTGLFENATSIEKLGDYLAVADSSKNIVVFFKPTEFAGTIYKGITDYEAGRYQESMDSWMRSLELSSNFEVGYIGVGRVLLRTGQYKEAMRYFRLGEYRSGYNQAFELYRQTILRGVVGIILVAIVLLIFLRFLWKRRRRRRAAQQLESGKEGISIGQ